MRGRSNSNHSKKNERKHTYHYSVITMVHKSAGSALESFQHVKADSFDEGSGNEMLETWQGSQHSACGGQGNEDSGHKRGR